MGKAAGTGRARGAVAGLVLAARGRVRPGAGATQTGVAERAERERWLRERRARGPQRPAGSPTAHRGAKADGLVPSSGTRPPRPAACRRSTLLDEIDAEPLRALQHRARRVGVE